MTKLKLATLTCLVFAVGCFFSLFMPIQNNPVGVFGLISALLLAYLFNEMNKKIKRGWQEDVLNILIKTFGLGFSILTIGVLGFWGFEAVFNFINKTNSQALSGNTVIWFAVVDLVICYLISVVSISSLRNRSSC